MASVVFLRAVNVGGANVCRPAMLAKQLSKFDVVNIGAVGTFVVRGQVAESVLRRAIAGKLSFQCEIIIVPARDMVKLGREAPFGGEPAGPDITRFVTVLAAPLAVLPRFPVNLPSKDAWVFKIIAVQKRFVLGIYRRKTGATRYLAKIEKSLRVPATTRSWTTMERILRVLSER